MADNASLNAQNPNIVGFVSSVVGFIVSISLSAVGYANNAWIYIDRPIKHDEFQRGVRGHDCYKVDRGEDEVIRCLPWEFFDKGSKFPTPFNDILDPPLLMSVSKYLALAILTLQLAWLIYAIAKCCCESFQKKAEIWEKLIFVANILTCFLFVVLLFFIFVLSFMDTIMIPIPENSTQKMGSGCFIFVIGGLVPFVAASYISFKKQYRAILGKKHESNHRNQDKEMERLNE
ncbi:unnamed protein product [Caenorhabditis bovis]|uniref:Uncharacterized protein n=1 Tax=Caenorhabditis bovis TaxID=2654633 RepID=A0A8S1EBW9_9PELO|nr:unnamed protein product [Caenorhabditis bovis]